MATTTSVCMLSHVANLLGEDLDLLEAIVSNDDNLTYGNIVSVQVDQQTYQTASANFATCSGLPGYRQRNGKASSRTSSAIQTSSHASRTCHCGSYRALTAHLIWHGNGCAETSTTQETTRPSPRPHRTTRL